MEKIPTAVEWLEDNLISEPWAEEHFKHNSECWDKAKEMEKEQHDNTAEEWWKQGAHYMESGGKCKWESFEQYYKETFKSE